MYLIRLLPLFALLILSYSPLFSQENFYLEKPPFKRILIEPGDSIRVQIVGMDQMVGLKYQGARDSTIFLSGDSLRLDQIEKIWIRRPRNARYWLSMVMGCGLSAALIFPPLMALDAVSRGGFQDYDIRRIGISLGGGLSIAAFAYRARWKRFRLDKRYRLAIRPLVENSVIGGSPSGGQIEWEERQVPKKEK